MKQSKGFTLIEVLVASTIIIVLMSVGLASYSRVNMRSRDAKRKSDIEQIRSALEIYRTDNGSYPAIIGIDADIWTNVSDLANASAVGCTPATFVPCYMPAIPADPKNTFVYRFKFTNKISGKFYGYCLSAKIEAETNPATTCTPNSTIPYLHNYGVKSP